MQESLTPQELKKEMWSKVPDWAQLVLAVITLGGLVFSTYVANEIARAGIEANVSRHTQEIAALQSEVKDFPVLLERVNQMYLQNEKSISTMERFADSVDRLSTNVARLDERMKAIESGRN